MRMFQVADCPLPDGRGQEGFGCRQQKERKGGGRGQNRDYIQSKDDIKSKGDILLL